MFDGSIILFTGASGSVGIPRFVWEKICPQYEVIPKQKTKKKTEKETKELRRINQRRDS